VFFVYRSDPQPPLVEFCITNTSYGFFSLWTCSTNLSPHVRHQVLLQDGCPQVIPPFDFGNVSTWLLFSFFFGFQIWAPFTFSTPRAESFLGPFFSSGGQIFLLPFSLPPLITPPRIHLHVRSPRNSSGLCPLFMGPIGTQFRFGEPQPTTSLGVLRSRPGVFFFYLLIFYPPWGPLGLWIYANPTIWPPCTRTHKTG